MMDFPKAAVIGVVGDVDAVRHDYILDGLDLPTRLRMQVEIEAKRRAGATVLVRASDPHILRLVSDEVWWLVSGMPRQKGDPDEVLRAYEREVLRSLSKSGEITAQMRRGDGRARLVAITVENAAGKPTDVCLSGETIRVRVVVEFQAEVSKPVVGIMIRTRIGMEVYGTNTELERIEVGPCRGGDTRTVSFEFDCNLCPQFYTVTAASHDPDGVWHDWIEDAIGFNVADSRYTAGVANLHARVTCSRG